MSVKARLIFADDFRPLEDYTLTMQGDTIVGLEPPGTSTSDVDWGAVAIVPPLVNAHTHLEFSSLAAPLPLPAGTFASWIESVVQHRQAACIIDPEFDRAIAQGLQLSAAAGCSLLGEIATCDQPPSAVGPGPVGGVRFRELIGVTVDRVAEQLKLAGQVVAEADHAGLSGRNPVGHESQPLRRFHPGLSPHAPYSVSWKLLQRVVELSRAAQIPLAMHLAESQDEMQLLERQDGPLADVLTGLGVWPPAHLQPGTRPLDYLRTLAAAHRTLVIHGNYLAEDELAFLAAHRDRMTLVFCPRTHAYFGHTACPLLRARQMGVRVALGTDSLASNPDLSVWREAQFVFSRYPEFPLSDLLRSITLFGSAALFGSHSRLTVGAKANFCVVALHEGLTTGLPVTEARDPFRRLFAPASRPLEIWWRGRRVHQEAMADSMTSRFEDCWFLTGPTASGKTGVGVELACRLQAEIISMDSMAVYRGMDIGTAKPSLDQQRQVPHHLIDVLAPHEDFSLANYLELAEECVTKIRARGRIPLFVGGTPLYLKAMLRGVFDGPPADWEFRQQVKQEVAIVGVQALHDRLALIDPLSASRLPPSDIRRIVRALEVYRLTGEPISHLQMQFDEGRSAEQCRVFVLEWPRATLHQRIEERVQTMFARGLVQEVRDLVAQYGTLGRTAAQAVGYREVLSYLAQNPEREVADSPARASYAETIERVVVRTRRFAKRQCTWFRSLSECRVVPRFQENDVAEIVDQIARC